MEKIVTNEITEKIMEDLISKLDHVANYVLKNEKYFEKFLIHEATQKGWTVDKLIAGLYYWRKEELKWKKYEKGNKDD